MNIPLNLESSFQELSNHSVPTRKASKTESSKKIKRLAEIGQKRADAVKMLDEVRFDL